MNKNIIDASLWLMILTVLMLSTLLSIASAASANSDPYFTPYKRLYGTVRVDDDDHSRGQIKLHGGFKYQLKHHDQWGNSFKKIRGLRSVCGDLFFSYSMASLWNIQDESGPFEDINHNPEVFCKYTHESHPGKIDERFSHQLGYEHLSNGVDNVSVDASGRTNRSRSIHNLNYIVTWKNKNGHWALAPKIWWNFTKSENKDIDDYWGNVDFKVTYATRVTDGAKVDPKKGVVTTIKLRGNPDTGKGRVDMDLSWPSKLLGLDNTLMFFQVFSGYGESLLDYDRQINSLRIGFQLTR